MSQPQVHIAASTNITQTDALPTVDGRGFTRSHSVADALGLTMDEVHADAQAGLSWLWHGYLAAGNITLLTSQWKTGKTTLMSILLARLREGGSLAGLPLAAGRAAIISEEGTVHWSLRGRKLGIGNHVRFLCRPFRGKPRVEEWHALIDRLGDWHARERIDLLVIDPLASFLPGQDENNAGSMLQALMPLQSLTSVGMSVLVLHHPRKGESAAGQAARGSGALTGHVDIIMEMACADPLTPTDRRRRLRAWSRYDDTLPERVIELNAAGDDYGALGDFHDAEFTGNWDRLRRVLDEADDKRSRAKILKDWPSEWDPPSEASLRRWLERAVEQGLVCRDGTGRRNSPHRHWLPGKVEEWRKHPFYREDLPDLDAFAAGE